MTVHSESRPKRGDEGGALGPSYRKLFSATVISNLGDGIGTVAYPWLASAITRNPVLIALVAVAQRLPWLVFTLPAGVITDRVDRRRAMVTMDVARGALTVLIAVAVLGAQGTLPGPDAVDTVTGTRVGLYAIVLTATLLLGMAEVLRDNSNQTIMPAIVQPHQLEKANGRIWSVEGVMNTFAGPPLGSLLLIAAFSLPFFVDAGTFFVAAALVALIPGSFRAERDATAPEQSFRKELGDGVRWLMATPVAASDGDHPRADERGVDDLVGDVRAVRPGGAAHRTAAVHGRVLRGRRRRPDRRLHRTVGRPPSGQRNRRSLSPSPAGRSARA